MINLMVVNMQKNLIKMKKGIKNTIEDLEKEFEDEATLITEAISDIITISKLNDEESATKLIRKQFVVIYRQDLK